MKKKFIELTEHEIQRLVVKRMAEEKQNTPGHNLVCIGKTAFGQNKRNAFDQWADSLSRRYYRAQIRI